MKSSPRIQFILGVSFVALLLMADPAANAQVQFSGPTNYAVGTAPAMVAVGDFNSDGKLDIAVANNSSANVSVLLGNGDGTFQPAVNYPAGLSPTAVAVADFNGDGKLDLVVANGSANTVSILVGNGDGSFQDPVPNDTGNAALFVAVGDFNGDGKPDVLVSTGSPGGASAVSVLIGAGDGTFRAAVTTPVDAVQTTSPIVALGDFNGDGHLDVAMAEASQDIEILGGALIVLLGKEDGTFETPTTFRISGMVHANGVVAGDFNRDGKLDVAISAGLGGCILLGNGDGTFSLDEGTGLSLTSVADLNDDGKLDLVGLGGDPIALQWMLGNGDGTFSSCGSVRLSFISNSLAVGDFNGDKLPDLVVTNEYVVSNNGTEVWVNNISVFLSSAVPTVTLSLTMTGSGSGAVTFQPSALDCSFSCSGNFPVGTIVTLTATPNSASNFSGWSGVCSGTGTCSLTMNAAASATATFSLPDFSLTPASSTLTVQSGAHGTDVVTIAGLNGSFANAIHLTCAIVGPAPRPTCALSPSSVTPRANTVTSTLTITEPTLAAIQTPAGIFQTAKFLYALWLPVIFATTFIAASTKHGRCRPLCGLLLFLGLLPACSGSNGGSSTPPPTSYTVTVTGTSAPLQHTTEVMVAVQ